MAFWQKEIGGIKRIWLGLLIGFYIFNYIIYVLTLSLNDLGYNDRPFDQVLIRYAKSHAIDYLLKFILTIPLYYLYFRLIIHWKMWSKLLLHVVTLIIYVFVWKVAFYFILESLGRSHLTGSSEVWDIYIPALFYFIQFAFLHGLAYLMNCSLRKNWH